MDNITCTCLSDQVQVDSPGELLHLEHLLHGVEVAHEHADSVEVEDVAVAITDRHMGFVRKRLFFYLPYTSIGTSTHPTKYFSCYVKHKLVATLLHISTLLNQELSKR